jgi:uncharacterized protein YdeI (YjbR/CyaY-like superfamily)
MDATTPIDAYVARSQLWPNEVAALRSVLVATGLDEELKWGKPCYCDEGRNIAIVQEFKSFLALMFFKGVAHRNGSTNCGSDSPTMTNSASRSTR